MKVRCVISLYEPKEEGRWWQEDYWLHWSIEREHSFNDHKQTAFSHMLICPSCHTIWAKLIIGEDEIVWPKAQFCERCPIISDPWHLVPGSLLVEEGWGVVDESLMEALPPELMLRELGLYVKAQETNSWEDQQTRKQTLGSMLGEVSQMNVGLGQEVEQKRDMEAFPAETRSSAPTE